MGGKREEVKKGAGGDSPEVGGGGGGRNSLDECPAEDFQKGGNFPQFSGNERW